MCHVHTSSRANVVNKPNIPVQPPKQKLDYEKKKKHKNEKVMVNSKARKTFTACNSF